MNSILTNNNKFFKTIVDKSDYWDFKIADSSFGGSAYDGLQVECLSAFIDTTFEDCVIENDGMIASIDNEKYLWDNAVSKSSIFENVGFTGVDNGFWHDVENDGSRERLLYDKEAITNNEFMELFTNSKFSTKEGDKRLLLTSANGNNKIYNYPEITYEAYDNNGKSINVAKLNGNFFQGVFKIGDGCGYNILPSKIETGWCMEFALMRKDFEPVSGTLNERHPDNAGIFFYIGTRAENKWWKYYKVDEEFEETGYVQPGEGEHEEENEDLNIETSSGLNIKDANMVKIESDNGFLIFDRTKEGVTVKDYEEGMKATIEMRKNMDGPNFFQYMNRTEDGFTYKDVDKLEWCSNQKYDVLGDLYQNALAFYISDAGSVGYRYYAKDCDENENNNVRTEFSNEGIIEKDKWYVIDVRIIPNTHYSKAVYGNVMAKAETMRMLFYVNGVLVLVSKELPILKLRQLNEVDEKQVGVPYNISIGGGTQGLCDVVYPDYKMLPEYVLPLEKHFCGSFIGYFKSFKFYDCDKNYEQINKNVMYEMNDLDLNFCWDDFGNITGNITKCGGDGYYLENLFGR